MRALRPGQTFVRTSVVVLALALALPAHAGPGEDDHALLEFHLFPRADLQLAIWLETADGQFVADVFVTQSTAKLGIANRSGEPLFLSSWRAPYGPREGVLPVWAHRRGKTYPKIVFADPSPQDHDSQAFHESSSSPETYFCRPLTPQEDEAIIDVLTCPSPATFRTDKGRFLAGEVSVYPPRGDLTTLDENDHADVALYAELNDLDAVSGASLLAVPEQIGFLLDRSLVPDGPLVAWIEVSLERDENEAWSFDRDADHTLDSFTNFSYFGREFLGQPSVVYRVGFDPAQIGYVASLDYAGYGDLYGHSGELFPPDASISVSDGSGADRLREHESFGVRGRFGVYSHGWGSAEGACPDYTPPMVEGLELEAVAHDRVRARFRLPQLPAGGEPARLFADWITPSTDAFDLAAAKSVSGLPQPCRDGQTPAADGCIDPRSDAPIELEIDGLFGNYDYSIAISYEDRCTNRSALALGQVVTPVQEFTTIDGACFVATAAWGAGWTEQLRTLRWLRDAWMIDRPIAHDLVRAYYAYGPVLAERVRELPPARAATRLLLRPVLWVARLLPR